MAVKRNPKPAPATVGQDDPVQVPVPVKAATAPVVGITPELLAKIGGSKDPNFNLTLLETVLATTWASPEERERRAGAAVIGLAAFEPRDAIEGMLAAQAIAQHHCVLECLRRSLLQQDAEIAADLRKSAASASNTFAKLVETLDRRRKDGQQRIKIEHVHINSGAQAIVGTVHSGPGGVCESGEPGPHEPKALTGKSFHEEPGTGPIFDPLRSEDSRGDSVHVSRAAGSDPMQASRRPRKRTANG